MAIDSLQTWWVAQAGSAQLSFVPLSSDRIGQVSEDGGDLPSCNGAPVRRGRATGTALVLDCDEGPAVVYDRDGLLVDLHKTFGPAGPVVVLAHEWGHVVQLQSSRTASGAVAELQADCLAGTWIAHLTRTEEAPFDRTGALDQALAAIVAFRDNVTSTISGNSSHGTGLDRAGALVDGYEDGLKACLAYDDHAPMLARRAAGTATGLAFDQWLVRVQESLDRRLGRWVDGTETPAVDELVDLAELERFHEAQGDFAAATWLSVRWLEAARPERSAQFDLRTRSCLTGAWLAALDVAEDGFAPGPDDLDEAILGLAQVTADTAPGDDQLFNTVRHLRDGFIHGRSACGLDPHG